MEFSRPSPMNIMLLVLTLTGMGPNPFHPHPFFFPISLNVLLLDNSKAKGRSGYLFSGSSPRLQVTGVGAFFDIKMTA